MKVVLVLLGLAALGVVALALAEIATRRLLRRRDRWYVWTPFKRVRIELERESLPSLPPVARLVFNADGERGDPLPDDLAGTYRVLVAGGSAAECYFQDQPDSWPAVLQRALNRPENLAVLGTDRAYVGNAARSLVSCEFITKILARILPRYERLDAIVLMVGASDVVYWLEQGTPAAIEDDRLDDSYMFTERPDGPFTWGPGGLALRRLLSHLRWRKTDREELRPRSGKRLIGLRAMRARAKILDEVPDPAPLVDYFERHFEQLLALCGRYANRVIVARQPWLDREFTPEEAARLWNFGRGRPYVEEVTTYYAHAVVAELLRRLDASAVRLAQRAGAEELFLLPAVDGGFDHFYDFLHFSPAGSQVVGEAVAHQILDPHEETPALPAREPRTPVVEAE